MSESLTVAETVEKFEVSMSTVRRYLRDGKFPNSTKRQGKVYIPIEDLESVQVKRRDIQGVSDTHHDSNKLEALREQLREASSENYQLRTELSAERVKTQALDKLAQSEHARINDLQGHISTLESTVKDQRELLAELRPTRGQIQASDAPKNVSDSVSSLSDTPAPKRSRWRWWLGA